MINTVIHMFSKTWNQSLCKMQNNPTVVKYYKALYRQLGSIISVQVQTLSVY